MSERKSINIILIGYIVLTITVLIMSSCGSSKEYHIGTGQELSRSNCSGNYINR